MTPDFFCPLCGFGAGVRLPPSVGDDRIRCLNCGGVSPARTVSPASGSSGFDADYQRDFHSLPGEEARDSISRSRSA